MQPRNAIITVHHERRVPTTLSCDGNTWDYDIVDEIEHVQARVWPVPMGERKLLVEWKDGTLGAVSLYDIRLGVMK